MDLTKFRETEDKYKDLKEKHARGEISTDEVKAELKRLMVKDDTGTYWMLGGKTGKWYKHDGAQWQEMDPYAEAEAPAEEDESFLELDASVKISEDEGEHINLSAAAPSVEKEKAAAADDDDGAFGAYGLASSEESYGAKSTGTAAAAADEDDGAFGAFGLASSEESHGKESTGTAAAAADEDDGAFGAYGLASSEESYGTESTGTAAAAADDDYSNVSFASFGTEITGAENAEAVPDLESFGAEKAESAEKAEDTDYSDYSDVSYASFTDEEQGTAGAQEEEESLDISYPGIETNRYHRLDAPVAAAAVKDNDYKEAIDATEVVKSSAVVENAYDGFDTYGTYEINPTEEEEAEAAVKPEDFLTMAGEEEHVDTQKFEYTVHKAKQAPPAVKTKEVKTKAAAPESQAAVEIPADEGAQEHITCGICKSRIPPYAVYCSFCGAHQKTLKQRTTMKPVKEESELLIKSINITSFLFFLGGVGLIFGVIFGASFGVLKDFLAELSPKLPMMLRESRGGWSGGLIFAAVGGIGGFIVSAVLAVVLSAIYNLIAVIFGGIRFKVKR